MRLTTTFYRRLLPLLLVLVLALAACGGDDEDSGDAGTGNGDTTSQTSDEANDSTNDTVLEAPSGRENTIHFTVSGDSVAEGSVETWRWATQPTPGTIDNPGPNTFSLLLYAQMMNQMITFNNVPFDISPGDYALTGPEGTGQNELNVTYIHDMANTYSSSVSGTLTIESVDNTLAGSFEFTAAKDTDTSLTITVQGEFSDVTMPTPQNDASE